MPINLNNDFMIYKQIYSEFPEYQGLRDGDKSFFDSLFILLFMKDVNQELSNKFLASRLGMAESTVEKRLRRLERACLITRFICRFKNDNGYWTTGRTIKLDNLTFAFVYNKNNVVFTKEEIELFKKRRNEVAAELLNTVTEEKEVKKRRIVNV